MILDKIIASTKIRVAKAKENLSPSGLLKALDISKTDLCRLTMFQLLRK